MRMNASDLLYYCYYHDHTSAMLHVGRLAPNRPIGVFCIFGKFGTACC